MADRDPQKMRVVFVGRRNAFDWGIIRWLHEHYTVCAAFFIEEDRFSLAARIRKLMARRRRYGTLRVLDELLGRFLYQLTFGRQEKRLWTVHVPEPFRNGTPLDIPVYSCGDVHEEKWLGTMREISPDIIFSVCTHTLFKPSLFRIPKYGLFMLHEGITPEYRGLHTVAWALLKGEPEYVGYTLLKIDEGVDSGPILCQGSYPDATKYGFCVGLVAHLALIHGLPEMKRALDELYRNEGAFQAISQEGRRSRNYTWVSLTDYLRHRPHLSRERFKAG